MSWNKNKQSELEAQSKVRNVNFGKGWTNIQPIQEQQTTVGSQEWDKINKHTLRFFLSTCVSNKRKKMLFEENIYDRCQCY